MKDPRIFDMDHADLSWCPGCGDFQILEALKKALAELDIAPDQVVVAAGIGQAAKLPHYMKCHCFNGLHGRALSCATAMKMANPDMLVLAVGGDGDMYGEGGNHFLHTIRRNPNVKNFVHNNGVYGLTKGQASPTSFVGMKTPTSPEGVFSEPINPVALAICLGASFVARAFSGDVEQTKEIMKQAILHRGYALVDIFQPCVSFNKINTFKWYKEHTYYLDGSHDPGDREAALRKAFEAEKMPLGLLYRRERPVFEDHLAPYREHRLPLYRRRRDMKDLETFIRKQYA
ncbi:thiamine pyrophosphate-dependent enzyme [Aminiphilus sp.]|uniref:thiamine pyrophosphate-dependent enzyme n=1 Tax=Aminiphilus sp. TaxID=1872488 RepID=UPI00261286D2|nr:thiamine pyrophosphate-dependent enzyme [Aminiphilus sp.]